jgi:Uma2 family endonuclease
MPLNNTVIKDKEHTQVDYSDKESLSIPVANEKGTEIVYPDSDGEPMGETGFHVRATMHLYNSLRHFFRDKTDVYVAADMFLYFKKGDPKAVKAPDVMVIKGVDKHERRIFKTWEEHTVPCVVFEVTSKSTMIEDLVAKSILYASLGVREYFVFDPLKEYLENRLAGFYLEGEEYIPLQPDDKGLLFSKELGIILTAEEDILRIIDPHTNRPIPGLDEAIEMVEQEAQRAEQEKHRAETAEAELARLRAIINSTEG